jgi:predicted dehydrogenase
MTQNRRVNRRRFLTSTAGAGLGAWAGSTVFQAGAARSGTLGPSEKVRIGFIGTGNMGNRHLEALAVDDRCEVVAICDCFRPRYEATLERFKGWSGGQTPDTYQDFRHVLDRPDIDAIFVVTPDHWHPLITILGCEAGKDVYVEKPACTTIEEGRKMVEAARRYGRVVQLGTQQRSMVVFQKAMRLVHGGALGQITSASAWVGVNAWSIGEQIQDPPEGLDWDLWLGPAPKVPYSAQRHYGFMGWHDYARGGQLTNWGVHLMDIVHWGIQQDRPLSIQSLGGSYRNSPGADNYETIDSLIEFPGCSVTWEQRHSNDHEGRGYGIMFQGTDGRLVVDRNGFTVKPAGLGIPEYIGEPERSWAHPPHHHNFFDSIRTRQRPAADIEQGVRSTSTVLLAGIALKVRRRLEWDGETETFIGDDAANRYLKRAYRPPWHL